ncbi:MAG TPA: MurR/RpiR family transcriptional regulator [Anaerolineales bacterium]|nr:MurR/RpiR family transcriptional regulator [Anaerolineales bacterium]
MSYESLIRENRQKLSKSFSRLADYILDNYVQAALMTATELAHQVDVDAATVVRFAQRLGYSGFPELQDEIKSKVKNELLVKPKQVKESDTFTSVVDSTMQRMNQALEQVRKLLDVDALHQIVEMIGKARRIIIISDGLGQVGAYNLLNLLEPGGFLVSVVQPGVVDLARTVSTAMAEDLVLAIDVSGGAPYIARALAEASGSSVSTAAIVGAASYTSALEAEVVVAAQHVDDVSLAVVVVDVVVYALAEALKWKYSERFVGMDKAIQDAFERLKVGAG